MEAIRETLDVLRNAVTFRLPTSFSARCGEVIATLAAERDVTRYSQQRRRQPSADLGGTTILDDLFKPTSSPDKWRALK